MKKLPDAFSEKMRSLLGEEYDAYLEALSRRPVRGLRVNTSKWSVQEAAERLPFALTRVPWTDNGFVCEDPDERPSAHPGYHCGLYYLQEPSAMAPAAFLPVSQGDRVLDLCAAPGGKTTQLALPLQQEGLLISNDVSASRAKALIRNIEIFGLKNTVVTCETPERLADRFSGWFDKILVDAPCSGEGMFRQGPRMWHAWEEHGPAYFAPIQRQILESAARMLAPGGMLIYSTCTFDPREDEQAVDHILQADPTLHPVQLPQAEGFEPGHPEWSDSGREDLCRTVRLYPHRIRGEGHFIALLRKEGERQLRPLGAPQIIERHIGKGTREKLIRMEVPDDIAGMSGLRFLRSGLTIGEVNRGRLIPSQAYAMTLRAGDYRPVLDLPAGDERAARYLRGESLILGDTEPMPASADLLVAIDGFPAGWGRVQGRRVKNRLLPGWRRQS